MLPYLLIFLKQLACLTVGQDPKPIQNFCPKLHKNDASDSATLKLNILSYNLNFTFQPPQHLELMKISVRLGVAVLA
jgi:hypothetical protein